MTDDWDRRCLTTILRRFYCHEAVAIDKFKLDDNGKSSAPQGQILSGYGCN